jgi:hypothetical protein
MTGRRSLDAEERHKGENAALPVVVDTHGDRHVIDGRHHDQCPDDERERSQRRACGRILAGEREHRLESVEGARPDIAEDGPRAERAATGRPAANARRPSRNEISPGESIAQRNPC